MRAKALSEGEKSFRAKRFLFEIQMENEMSKMETYLTLSMIHPCLRFATSRTSL